MNAAGVPPVAAIPLTYVRVPVVGPKRLFALIDSLGPTAWWFALKLNRVDLAHVRDRDSLVLASSWTDTLALSPFPRTIPALFDTAKCAFVSVRVQAYACYDGGRLVRWGPVSSGRKETPTPVGLYFTNWKARSRVSTVDEAWLLNWYVNLQNFEGVSFHQYELPGRPASHSCVRLLEEDAIGLYAWCEQWRLAPEGRTILRNGTPVVVFGEWKWGRREPWKRMPEEPRACTLGADEIEAALRVLSSGERPHFVAVVRDSSNTAPRPPPPPSPDSASGVAR
jgi:hypothetical protein